MGAYDYRGTAAPVADDLPLFTDTGRSRRDEGIGLVDVAEDIAWKSKADAAIATLALSPEPFTAEDVRRIAGTPRHPNAMGARLNANAKAGVIRHFGWTEADRPEAHARALRLWVGVAA